MNIDIKNVKMLMWEKKEMPEREYNKETKEWKDTGNGNKVEKTLYLFRDDFGSTLSLYAGNEYRNLEGKQVDIGAEVDQKDFQGKKTTRIKIQSIHESSPTQK